MIDKCRAINALAYRLDITTFRVAHNSQARGGGSRRGGGGYQGGRMGGRVGPVRCYNCDEV